MNAAILQPLGYPQPEQLRFLTTRFGDGERGQPAVAGRILRVDRNQSSFSVVGAFVTGEVNLAARDRPRRVSERR